MWKVLAVGCPTGLALALSADELRGDHELEPENEANQLPQGMHTLLLCAAVFAFLGAGDPATRFNEIGHQMMCICGCNQILLEFNHVGCPDSDRMRNELMASLSRGDSDSLVEQGFVQKYGPTVLAAPTTKVSTAQPISCPSPR